MRKVFIIMVLLALMTILGCVGGGDPRPNLSREELRDDSRPNLSREELRDQFKEIKEIVAERQERANTNHQSTGYTTSELRDMYDANELTISNMYGDTITVTGTIERITKMSTFIPGAGDPAIFLDNGVRCQLYKKNKDIVSRLRVGQTITITGTVDYPWAGMVCINRGNI